MQLPTSFKGSGGVVLFPNNVIQDPSALGVSTSTSQQRVKPRSSSSNKNPANTGSQLSQRNDISTAQSNSRNINHSYKITPKSDIFNESFNILNGLHQQQNHQNQFSSEQPLYRDSYSPEQFDKSYSNSNKPMFIRRNGVQNRGSHSSQPQQQLEQQQELEKMSKATYQKSNNRITLIQVMEKTKSALSNPQQEVNRSEKKEKMNVSLAKKHQLFLRNQKRKAYFVSKAMQDDNNKEQQSTDFNFNPVPQKLIDYEYFNKYAIINKRNSQKDISDPPPPIQSKRVNSITNNDRDNSPQSKEFSSSKGLVLLPSVFRNFPKNILERYSASREAQEIEPQDLIKVKSFDTPFTTTSSVFLEKKRIQNNNTQQIQNRQLGEFIESKEIVVVKRARQSNQFAKEDQSTKSVWLSNRNSPRSSISQQQSQFDQPEIIISPIGYYNVSPVRVGIDTPLPGMNNDSNGNQSERNMKSERSRIRSGNSNVSSARQTNDLSEKSRREPINQSWVEVNNFADTQISATKTEAKLGAMSSFAKKIGESQYLERQLSYAEDYSNDDDTRDRESDDISFLGEGQVDEKRGSCSSRLWMRSQLQQSQQLSSRGFNDSQKNQSVRSRCFKNRQDLTMNQIASNLQGQPTSVGGFGDDNNIVSDVCWNQFSIDEYVHQIKDK